MKVILIVPYFGNIPSWIDFFLESCGKNPEINWLLYGNFSKTSLDFPNVSYKKANIEDFNKLCLKHLGFNVNIHNPYKICDLRPAFGKIFSEFTYNYDFWGYCDLDLVFGKIQNFINHRILNEYDIITSRMDFIAGHFTLYKNTCFVNDLFKKIFKHKKIMSDFYRHYYLDEELNYIGVKLNGTPEEFFDYLPWFIRKIIRSFRFRILKKLPRLYDITKVAEYLEKKGELKVKRLGTVRSDIYYLNQGIKDWNIMWNNGKLIDKKDDEQLMYFHFLKTKNNANFTINSFKKNREFHIIPEGIRN